MLSRREFLAAALAAPVAAALPVADPLEVSPSFGFDFDYQTLSLDEVQELYIRPAVMQFAKNFDEFFLSARGRELLDPVGLPE